MAITVATLSGGSIQQTSRRVFRTSSGIPYVVVNDSNIKIYKGNSTTPTSFAEQDGSNRPSNGTGLSAVIDSNNVIHVFSWSVDSKNGGVRYVTFNTSTDTWGTQSQIINQTADQPSYFTSAAVDSNDKVHLSYVDKVSNMGTNYDTVKYSNNISGSWSSPVTIDGAPNLINANEPKISIDADSIPIITTNSNSTQICWLGNNNNSTSFTSSGSLGATGSLLNKKLSLGVDSLGNHYAVRTTNNSSDHLSIRKHSYADSWTTWSSNTVIDANILWEAPSLVIDGTDLYVFAEKTDIQDIGYFKSTNFTSWDSFVVTDAGTYQTPVGKWAFWVDNDSGGTVWTENIVTYYADGSDAAASDPNNVWANETNADDGSTSTFATTSSNGSESTNYLLVEGTNAPSSGDIIKKVEFRVYAGESGAEFWSVYVNIPAPVATWTWAKIQALEFKSRYLTASTQGTAYVYEDGQGSGFTELTNVSILNVPTTLSVARFEVRVTTLSSPIRSELDYIFSDSNPYIVLFNSLTLAAGPTTNIKLLSGIAQASLKKISGITNANTKKVSEITNV